VDIGEEVDPDRISGKGVRINPGCRIYGKKTALSAGTQLGAEEPVTIEDCRTGFDVELRGGYFSRSVFLDKANMGLGAHVREGCILEEEASGAHCVGLKQTILFPFVTLGSLINFCDCLIAGGTGRKNHTEVGSSYIHFNFTPDGDKTTPSLIGDVPRGVMLNQPPIFLGGQGGIVGPLRIGYGNIVAAGSILLTDYLVENKLIIGQTHQGEVRSYTPATYSKSKLTRIVDNNVIYLANLAALEEWYCQIRRGFLHGREMGAFLFEGLLDMLAAARKERLKRLRAMAERASEPAENEKALHAADARKEFSSNIARIEEVFGSRAGASIAKDLRDRFLADFEKATAGRSSSYVETIQALPKAVSEAGVEWLSRIVAVLRERVAAAMPSLIGRA
jgi:UDP-N-acetylglucosamine/UDP-N-acetylgalactosamine diphosphorylase